MSKASKEHMWRIQGMIYALNIAKKDGVAALERDIRMRNFLRAPLKFTQKDIDDYIEFTITNIYSTTMTVWFMALNKTYGFGKKRLERLKECYDEFSLGIMDFDYLGNHYASLEDYAVYLKEKYGCGIDVERVAMCQNTSNVDKENKHKADVWEIINVLRENGYEDAAKFIEEKI